MDGEGLCVEVGGAGVFVADEVREVGQAQEARGGVAGGVDLRDEGDDGVDVGDAEQEHAEDGQDLLRRERAGGGQQRAVVEDQRRDEDDAGVRNAEEEAGEGRAPGARLHRCERRGHVLVVEIRFESEGAHGADVHKGLVENGAGGIAHIVALPLPASAHGFEAACDTVHGGRGGEADECELPADGQRPDHRDRHHGGGDEAEPGEAADQVTHFFGVAIETFCEGGQIVLVSVEPCARLVEDAFHCAEAKGVDPGLATEFEEIVHEVGCCSIYDRDTED